MHNTKQLYFAWCRYQGRQVSMAPYFGFKTILLPVEGRVGKIKKVLLYLKHGWSTLATLVRSRPTIVWVQLPQVPLMWVALLYRYMFRRDAVVIADCHNAMFRPPWSKVPLGISLLSRCNIVLVHNDDVLETALQLGVDRGCMMVVENPPASFPPVGPFLGAPDMPRPWFVFPGSFAQDEPLAELIEAARKVPEVSILITGNVHDCREPDLIKKAPANVRFLDFLSTEDFVSLIVGCDAVIAFTRFDGIQLNVCGEAVGAGKPMLISDTQTLRRLFPSGTVFVNSSDVSAIADGFIRLLSNRVELAEEMKRFCQDMTSRWIQTRCRPLIQRIGLEPIV